MRLKQGFHRWRINDAQDDEVEPRLLPRLLIQLAANCPDIIVFGSMELRLPMSLDLCDSAQAPRMTPCRGPWR